MGVEKLNELNAAQEPARELLRELGYTYVPREMLAAERDRERDALLRGRLKDALLRLNLWLNDDGAERAIFRVQHVDAVGIGRNKLIHEYLTYGLPLDVDERSGRQTRTVRSAATLGELQSKRSAAVQLAGRDGAAGRNRLRGSTRAAAPAHPQAYGGVLGGAGAAAAGLPVAARAAQGDWCAAYTLGRWRWTPIAWPNPAVVRVEQMGGSAMLSAAPRRAVASSLLGALLPAMSACGSAASSPGARAPAAGDAPAGAAGPGAAATPAPLRDVRTSFPSAAASFAPLWAAYEYGLFAQHGLRAAEPVMISGGPANAQTLSARELDASYTAFSPMVGAIAGGAPLKVVASFGRGFSFALFAKPGSGVTTVQDMRGRRAGVSRVGSESYTVIRNWARAAGLRDDDITYVNAGTVAERLVAMEAGAIDLMPLDPPVVVVAEKRGFVLVADLTREPLPWQRESLTLHESTLRDDPPFAAVITRAISEAAYLIRSDRERFDAVVGKWIRQDDPDALGAAYRAALNGWIGRGRPDPADVRAVQESVDEEVAGAASQPYSHFVDLRVLDRLEQEGFFERLERQYPLPAGALSGR